MMSHFTRWRANLKMTRSLISWTKSLWCQEMKTTGRVYMKSHTLSTRRCDSKEKRFSRTPTSTKRLTTGRTTLPALVHSKEQCHNHRALTDTPPTRVNRRPQSPSTRSTQTTASKITGTYPFSTQVAGSLVCLLKEMNQRCANLICRSAVRRTSVKASKDKSGRSTQMRTRSSSQDRASYLKRRSLVHSLTIDRHL